MFARSHLNQWLGVVVCTCHPSYSGKPEVEGQHFRKTWAKKQDPSSKITKTGLKRQTACLPSAKLSVHILILPKIKSSQTKKALCTINLC
jgi:hypothetical protein